jgi:hypothetical protein
MTLSIQPYDVFGYYYGSNDFHKQRFREHGQMLGDLSGTLA